MDALIPLQLAYKQEIGELLPDDADFQSLKRAIADQKILFYGCMDGDKLVACCSITPTYSTFCYRQCGVFEDFYILPQYRKQGIARKLVRYAYETSGVTSLTVGCADCDVEMYRSLGFDIPLGNMLAFAD